MNKIFIILVILIYSCSPLEYKITGEDLQGVRFTEIKGTGQFSNPILLYGDKGNPISVYKYGYSAPALYDWDKDGKLDLLVGEFGSKEESNVAVFLNIGTKNEPIFNSESFYATDKNGEKLFIYGS